MSYDDIPKGYFLGLNYENIQLIKEILEWIDIDNDNNNGNIQVIDIGSGKGFIDRILTGYYNIPVYCIESNKDRNYQSIKLQRLINDDKINRIDPDNNNNINAIKLLGSCNCKISSYESYCKVVRDALQFFNKVSISRTNSKIVIIGIKLCGDMIYELIDYQIRYREEYKDEDEDKYEYEFEMFIIPCCTELSKRGGNSCDNVISYCKEVNTVAEKRVFAEKYYGIKIRHPINQS